jgi:hypothetical protein
MPARPAASPPEPVFRLRHRLGRVLAALTAAATVVLASACGTSTGASPGPDIRVRVPLAAQAHGALNIRILAANSQCGTDTQAVLALPGSGITGPGDLAGKIIAVNVSPNIQTLTITRQLQAGGVPTGGVRYVVIPFADMATALTAPPPQPRNSNEPPGRSAADGAWCDRGPRLARPGAHAGPRTTRPYLGGRRPQSR